MSPANRTPKQVSDSSQELERHVSLLESIKPGSPEHEILRANTEVHRETARIVNIRHMWRYASYVTAGGLVGAFCSYVLGWTPSLKDIASHSLHLTGSIMTGGGAVFGLAGDFVDMVGNYVPEAAAGVVAGVICFVLLALGYKIAKSLNFVAPAIILGASWILLTPLLGASAALAIGVGGAAGHYAHVLSKDAESARKAARNVRIVAKTIVHPAGAVRDAKMRKHLRDRHAKVRNDLGLS